jgi:hypothetical protein
VLGRSIRTAYVALMRADEDIAERLDQERFAAGEAARAGEVAQVIADGATD